jgi:hypothetical protein
MKPTKIDIIRNLIARIDALEAFKDGCLPAVGLRNEGEEEDNQTIQDAVNNQIRKLKRRIKNA